MVANSWHLVCHRVGELHRGCGYLCHRVCHLVEGDHFQAVIAVPVEHFLHVQVIDHWAAIASNVIDVMLVASTN
jgi:hypothetical protein